jgi:hypothetical protein
MKIPLHLKEVIENKRKKQMTIAAKHGLRLPEILNEANYSCELPRVTLCIGKLIEIDFTYNASLLYKLVSKVILVYNQCSNIDQVDWLLTMKLESLGIHNEVINGDLPLTLTDIKREIILSSIYMLAVKGNTVDEITSIVSTIVPMSPTDILVIIIQFKDGYIIPHNLQYLNIMFKLYCLLGFNK